VLITWPFLTRRNHKYYILDHGDLVPVEFEGGMRGGTMPQPGMMGPYGQVAYPQQMGPPQYPQPNYQHPPPSYQSPYAQGQYSAPPSNYRQQSNYQPGYAGPSPPQQ
jgi:hypothetical protein